MKPEVVHYSLATSSIKVWKRDSRDTQVVTELLPGDPSEIICINLLTAALDTDTEYDALSYEWCLPKTSSRAGYYNIFVEMKYFCHILCDGKHMSIMNNPHVALLSLRRWFRSLIVWADGICIDQDDPVEIPQQLLLMSKIYRQAKPVLC